MYFISKVNGNDCYVTDTSDWVEEKYTKSDIAKFKTLGIDIKNATIQEKVLRFFWFYDCITGDVGSSSKMDLVDEYLVNSSQLKYLHSRIGSSTTDTIISLRKLYVDLKSYWTDLNPNNIRGMSLFSDASACCNARRHHNEDLVDKYIAKIHSKYHFDVEAIKTGLWL